MLVNGEPRWQRDVEESWLGPSDVSLFSPFFFPENLHIFLMSDLSFCFFLENLIDQYLLIPSTVCF